jgi:hypothetical protein
MGAMGAMGGMGAMGAMGAAQGNPYMMPRMPGCVV